MDIGLPRPIHGHDAYDRLVALYNYIADAEKDYDELSQSPQEGMDNTFFETLAYALFTARFTFLAKFAAQKHGALKNPAYDIVAPFPHLQDSFNDNVLEIAKKIKQDPLKIIHLGGDLPIITINRVNAISASIPYLLQEDLEGGIKKANTICQMAMISN